MSSLSLQSNFGSMDCMSVSEILKECFFMLTVPSGNVFLCPFVRISPYTNALFIYAFYL